MKKDARNYGILAGAFVLRLYANFYWLFPKLRLYKHKHDQRPRRSPIIKPFIWGFLSTSHLSLVMCESCRAIGIDYQSEKHGWKYEGYHIWSCPECKETWK